ncbi:MAG TPA: hypothetical protein VEA44_07355, partial [Caulobacter sp.]|nr:hypothetical protein [Caulobacter sp.]
MRILLLLVLALLPPSGAHAMAPQFMERLGAMGPQALQVSEDLGPPTGEARLEVESDGALRLTWGEGLARTFRFHPDEPPKDPWTAPERSFEPFAHHCRGKGSAERLEVSCWIPSDLRARALRPPSVVYVFEIDAGRVRVVRTSGRGGGRMVFTPAGLEPSRPPGVGPGGPAVLADALAQLAAFEDGWLGGGSSGGGDWYGSDLRVSDVRGLDFTLERTVSPDRGGRSHLVPARWSFDYQGPV